jgi:hypothetical protein
MFKRCFICGAKQDADGHCTNADCPRYVVTTTTSENSTTAEKTA